MRISLTALIVFVTISAVSPTAHQVLPNPPLTLPTQTPPAVPLVPAPAPAALPVDRVFAADAGLIFNPIRPDKVADFEMVISRVHDALARSADPVRRRQAAGWKIFKATEPGPNSSVLYVFAMDPAVAGADYTVSRVLAEAFPMEVRDLYRLYNGAFAGAPSLLNLKVFADLGAPFTPTTIAPKLPVTR